MGSVILLPRASLSIGGRRRSRTGQLLVRKDPRESGELVISDPSTGKPWLQATARRVEVSEPGGNGFPPAAPGDWIVEVRLDDSSQWGVSREELHFRTGLAREPEVKVPVIVTVISPVSFRPDSLVLPMPSPGQRSEATILAVVRRDRASEQLRAEVSPEAFHVSLSKTGARHYQAVVSWKASGPETVRDGTVTFLIGEDSLAVPVRVGGPAR